MSVLRDVLLFLVTDIVSPYITTLCRAAGHPSEVKLPLFIQNYQAAHIANNAPVILSNMQDQTEELMTVNDAARLLRVSATTVRNWASDGRLTETRTAGGHRRFRAADVRRLARAVVPKHRQSILLIDDDDAVRFVIREALTSVGFDVIEARSGLLGLDELDQQTPALIMLDIMMPGIDGFQVMKYLSQFAVKVPVLVLSALGNRAERHAHELGADGFVAKPFDIRDLVIKARETIERAQEKAVRESFA